MALLGKIHNASVALKGSLIQQPDQIIQLCKCEQSSRWLRSKYSTCCRQDYAITTICLSRPAHGPQWAPLHKILKQHSFCLLMIVRCGLQQKKPLMLSRCSLHCKIRGKQELSSIDLLEPAGIYFSRRSETLT